MSKKITTDIFIEKAKNIYGNKYDYSKVVYINSRTKVKIICPIHGEFEITPSNFLRAHECPGCTKGNSIIEFIKKAKQVHGDKYDYSKVMYKNARTKVTIICPEHGEFEQTPLNHISGTGCPKCNVDKKRTGLENFIKRSSKIHGNKYTYDKVNYINNRTKVCITCPEHGDFWQIPTDHLRGIGCLKCRSSHLENDIRKSLQINLINFEEQKTWNWLIYKSNLYVDFYLPDYKIVIECQGIQHFETIDFFGGTNEFEKTKEKDEQKVKLCNKNNIIVLYYSNLGKDYQYPYDVFTDIDDLINEIKRIGLTNRS